VMQPVKNFTGGLGEFDGHTGQHRFLTARINRNQYFRRRFHSK
jgi:hypothetical protein